MLIKDGRIKFVYLVLVFGLLSGCTLAAPGLSTPTPSDSTGSNNKATPSPSGAGDNQYGASK